MKLVQYLKPLSDFSFLYAIFGTIVVLSFSAQQSLWPMLILSAIQVLGYLLKGKGYRYVALLPALGLIPFFQQPVDAIMPTVAVVYLFLTIRKEGYYFVGDDEVDRFRLQIKILVGLVVVGYIMGIGTAIAQYTLPCVYLYLTSSNLLLRMLRADRETMASPSFLRFNLISLVAVLVGAVVASSDLVLGTILGAVGYVYTNVVVPIIIAVITGILWGINWLYQLIAGLFNAEVALSFDDVTLDMFSVDELTGGEVAEMVETPGWMEIAAITFVVLVVLALLALVLRKMLGGEKEGKGDGHITVTESVVTASQEKGGFSLFLSPREKLRKYYAEFINHAKKHGVVVRSSTDTAQLETMYGPTPETKVLRDCYRLARYDQSHEISKEELTKAKEALKGIKSQER